MTDEKGDVRRDRSPPSKRGEESQKVEFHITEGPKGPQAASVRPVA